MVSSFEDFLRPEYCKVVEVSAEKLRQEWEQSQRDRDEYAGAHDDKNQAFRSAGVVQDFDTLLYNGEEGSGPEVYKKFLGRLQVEASELVARGAHKPKPMLLPVKPRSLGEAIQDPTPEDLPHYLKVTDRSGETDINMLKREVLRIIKVHLNETKGVLQVFD